MYFLPSSSCSRWSRAAEIISQSDLCDLHCALPLANAKGSTAFVTVRVALLLAWCCVKESDTAQITCFTAPGLNEAEHLILGLLSVLFFFYPTITYSLASDST